MSQENVDIVRRTFDAFARREQAAWNALTDPGVEAIPIGDWPEGRIQGREAVWDFFLKVEEPWEPGRYELVEVTDGEDTVAGRMRRDLRGKSSGVEVTYDYWVVFTFSSGLCSRVEWFETWDRAPEAAGLRE